MEEQLKTHIVYSVCDRKTFAPLFQESWWRGQGSSKADFIMKEIYRDGALLTTADTASRKKRPFDTFQLAINRSIFNWHLDLETYPLHQCKARRTFVIDFYDPGTSFPPSKEAYTVKGSDRLRNE